MKKYRVRRSVLRAGSFVFKKCASPRINRLSDVMFIWVPKTAGTSVFSMFRDLGMGKYKSIDQARYRFPGSGMATFVHQSIPSLVAAGALNESYVRSAFKFMFARNPYDRCVSLYHYFLRYGRIPHEMDFAKFVTILESQWPLNRDLQPPDPDTLPAKVCYRGEQVTQGNHTLYPPGAYNVLEWSQCRPQTDWITGVSGAGDIHVGRMENIDKDIIRILDAMMIDCDSDLKNALSKHSRTLPKHNVTPHGHYMDYFKDPHLRKIVENVYLNDFETFGY
jgi:hypothetical protein